MIKPEDILNSYNFARNSDVVYSEIVTRDQFNILDLENFKITKIINIGIISSIFSHRLGEFINNLVKKITFNKFGFILIAEIY